MGFFHWHRGGSCRFGERDLSSSRTCLSIHNPCFELSFFSGVAQLKHKFDKAMDIRLLVTSVINVHMAMIDTREYQ